MPLPLMGIAAGLYKAGQAVSKSTVWKGAMKGVVSTFSAAKKAAPAIAKPVGAIGIGGAAWGAGQGIGQKVTGYQQPTGNLPALPGMGFPAGGGLPATQGSFQVGTMMPEMLAPNTLRVFYRAPKGFVIIRDPQTRQVIGAVRKDVARRAKLWKPSKKPPISATEWQHYKDAERVEKKLRKIASSAIRKHSRPHAATCTTRKRK